MNKKVFVLGVVVLILVGIAGAFWWWQDQADVRELNKNLPAGVRVVKTLTREYKVVNKIDGYEFRMPEEWRGLEEIEYIPETIEEKYTVASINTKGLRGEARFVAIDKFKVENGLVLEGWAQEIFNEYGLSGEFSKDTVGDIETVKAQENIHLAGMYVYFFKKDSAIYAITCGSEESIQGIIINGKW